MLLGIQEKQDTQTALMHSLKGEFSQQFETFSASVQASIGSLKTYVDEKTAVLSTAVQELKTSLNQASELLQLATAGRGLWLKASVLDSKLEPGKYAGDYVSSQLNTLGYRGNVTVTRVGAYTTKQQQGSVPAGSKVWLVDFQVQDTNSAMIIRTKVAPKHTPQTLSAWSADFPFLNIEVQKTKSEVAAEKTIRASPDFQQACRMAKAQGQKIRSNYGVYIVGTEIWDTAKVAARAQASGSAPVSGQA